MYEDHNHKKTNSMNYRPNSCMTVTSTTPISKTTSNNANGNLNGDHSKTIPASIERIGVGRTLENSISPTHEASTIISFIRKIITNMGNIKTLPVSVRNPIINVSGSIPNNNAIGINKDTLLSSKCPSLIQCFSDSLQHAHIYLPTNGSFLCPPSLFDWSIVYSEMIVENNYRHHNTTLQLALQQSLHETITGSPTNNIISSLHEHGTPPNTTNYSALKRSIQKIVVLDIGANIGLYSITIVQEFRQLLAELAALTPFTTSNTSSSSNNRFQLHLHTFEPIPFIYNILRYNMHRLQNVLIIEHSVDEFQACDPVYDESHHSPSQINDLIKYNIVIHLYPFGVSSSFYTTVFRYHPFITFASSALKYIEETLLIPLKKHSLQTIWCALLSDLKIVQHAYRHALLTSRKTSEAIISSPISHSPMHSATAIAAHAESFTFLNRILISSKVTNVLETLLQLSTSYLFFISFVILFSPFFLLLICHMKLIDWLFAGQIEVNLVPLSAIFPLLSSSTKSSPSSDIPRFQNSQSSHTNNSVHIPKDSDRVDYMDNSTFAICKIDVEGGEFDVIQGLSSELLFNIQNMVIEVHNINSRLSNMKTCLEEKNFTCIYEQEIWQMHRLMNIFTLFCQKKKVE